MDEGQRRIAAEAALLTALASDSAESVSQALSGEVPAVELLSLRVKATFNNPTDNNAFFHSVASYGLDFQIGDTAEDLSARNGLAAAENALKEACKSSDGCRADQRIQAEAALLAAVAADDCIKIRSVLRGGLNADLLSIAVKETFGDAADKAAFFHSVASFGLRYQLGDTILQLAEKNDRTQALRMLKRFQPITLRHTSPLDAGVQEPAPVPDQQAMLDEDTRLHVVVRNALSGELATELQASTAWTVGMLADRLSKLLPATGGCRVLMNGASALTPGAVLADLADGEDNLVLSTAVVTFAEGTYCATIAADEDEPPLVGPRGRLLRARPNKPKKLSVQLEEGGAAKLKFEAFPVDTGSCAGSSGGRLVLAQGSWCFEVPGIVLNLTEGTECAMSRGRWGERCAWQQHQRIMMSMIQEGQLLVSESKGLTTGGSYPVGCLPGTVFSKSEADEM